jgi:glycosyltransferase involved in cell wall biosynthesis
MKKLLIVAPYPQGKAPSQRFRFEQYLGALDANGVGWEIASFWSQRHWPAIYRKGSLALKIYATLEGFARRFFLLFRLGNFDRILIHREATPVGPPWWEYIAAKWFGKTLIYDFDDAVWLPNNSDANEKLVGKFKAHGKTSKIISLSSRVLAGNAFLAGYASQWCNNVVVMPTTIDTVHHHNRIKSHGSCAVPVIGWTGTHSTTRQLTPLFPALAKLYETQPFSLLIIADKAPENLPPFATFISWNKDTEIDDLLRIDVGIMPLYNTEWERGKCGFKALQYMALGIPAVVSAVGVNTEIVQHGVNGFVCESMPVPHTDSWSSALTALLNNHSLRASMGAEARKRVEAEYSVEAWKERFVDAVNRQ